MCGSDLLCTSREANAMFKITRISSMALLQKKKVTVSGLKGRFPDPGLSLLFLGPDRMHTMIKFESRLYKGVQFHYS